MGSIASKVFYTVEDEKVEAELFDDYNEIDDVEDFDADSLSSRRQLASYAVRSSYGEFRKSGVHQGGPFQPMMGTSFHFE